MRPKDEARDLRKSFRCPTTESRRQCALIVGKTRLAVRLLDESAGGFAVLADGQPGVTENQQARLATAAGQFQVRVIHVRQIDPDDAADGASAGAESPRFRIGLSRLGEVESAGEETAICPAGRELRCSLWKWCPSSVSMVVVGVLFTLVVIALPLAMMGTFQRDGDRWLKRLAFWGGLRSPAAAVSGDEESGSPRKSSAEQGDFDAPSPFGSLPYSGRSARSTTTSAGAQLSLRDTVRRLPGATPLTLPEVVQALKLSGVQQRKIRLVIDAATQAVRDLDSRLQGRQRQQFSAIRAQAFEEERKEALKVLDAEQLAKWEELTK